MLFPLAPVLGVPLSGVLSPGQYGAFANEYVRFGGYLGRNGPPADYVGGGVALAALAAVVAARRRPAHVAARLHDGRHAVAGARRVPRGRAELARAPLAALARALGAARCSRRSCRTSSRRSSRSSSPSCSRSASTRSTSRTGGRPRGWRATAARSPRRPRRVVAVVALVPVFVTFDLPFRVVPLAHARLHAPGRAGAPGRTRCCSPSPSPSRAPRSRCSGRRSTAMHFRLAGAALKTPNALGGPVGRGGAGVGPADPDRPDRARGARSPPGRRRRSRRSAAPCAQWQVDDVVISRRTAATPSMPRGSSPWCWARRRPTSAGPGCGGCNRGDRRPTPATGASLSRCRAAAAAPTARPTRLVMSSCVLFGAGRS